MDSFRYGENLLSIKGLSEEFSGRSLFRTLLTPLLRLTSIVKVDSERPNYYPGLTKDSITAIGSNISNLALGSDKFSIQFDYVIDDQADAFIEVFSEIWFAYEQPKAIFIVSSIHQSTSNQFSRTSSWEEVTNSLSCYVTFKSIEDDVMWIGKSSDMSFDEVVT